MARFAKLAILCLLPGLALTAAGYGSGTEVMVDCEKITGQKQPDKFEIGQTVTLPKPLLSGSVSIEEALQFRISLREYADAALTLAEISQLLWAAQGENANGSRTVPSAGALYPLNVYLISGSVNGLRPGIYQYLPESHELLLLAEGDQRAKLAAASLAQEAITKAPAAIVLSGVFERTTPKYGERGEPTLFTWKAGMPRKNIYLQAVSLELGTISIGSFDDQAVRRSGSKGAAAYGENGAATLRDAYRSNA